MRVRVTWIQKNYELPWIGAWHGIHVYVFSELKEFYSFKKRFTMTNLALVGTRREFFTAIEENSLQLELHMHMLEC